jgi:pyridoxal phosphate enzyme (YggS family)
MTLAAEDELDRRLDRVRERIEAAADRSGRAVDDVELLPVTKGHPPAVVRLVAEHGFGMVGENRVGQAEEKLAELGRLGVRWHMVGHLQRNKAGRAVRVFDELESLDSLRLARKLQRELEDADRDELPALLQVNASGEESKGGFDATDPGSPDLADRVRTVCSHDRLRVRGLMTMAPLTDDETVLRTTFRRTREAFERLGERVEAFEAHTLSMGMSNDFEIAVEEGSTRLRLGTALLGERPEP